MFLARFLIKISRTRRQSVRNTKNSTSSSRAPSPEEVPFPHHYHRWTDDWFVSVLSACGAGVVPHIHKSLISKKEAGPSSKHGWRRRPSGSKIFCLIRGTLPLKIHHLRSFGLIIHEAGKSALCSNNVKGNWFRDAQLYTENLGKPTINNAQQRLTWI